MAVIISTDDGKYLRINHSMKQWDDGWPDSTSLLCWYCCHGFDTKPIPLPVDYDEKRDLFRVMGNFCSWNCVKAYNRDRLVNHARRGSAENTLTLFYKRCNGKIQSFAAAPPRFLLSAFGGPMSIQDFREKGLSGISYTQIPVRMILQEQVVHEHKHNESIRRAARAKTNMSDTVDLGQITTNNETLKLRRPKPVKSNQNMLERTLGLLKM